MLRRIAVGLASSTALLLTLPAAQGADMPLRPIYKAPMYEAPAPAWAGWYAGLNAGYGWDDPNVKLGAASLTLSPDGFLFGGQVGYNMQAGRFVYGLEADIDYTTIKDSASATTTTGGRTPTVSTADAEHRLEWFGTVRGRLGYALWDSLLLYGTGGLAYGDGKLDGDLRVASARAAVSGSGTDSKFMFGWTLGAGAEWMFLPAWSLKAEYLYYDLGKITTSFNVGATAVSETTPYKGSVVRGGVNYHF